MRPSPCKAAPSFVRNSLKELNERVTVVKSPLHSQSQLVERCSRLILFHHKQPVSARSEEHTSELQSLRHLVCRLLLENKGRLLTINFQDFPPTANTAVDARGPVLRRR